MIKGMLISHSDGIGYYSRSFNGFDFSGFDPNLFGGLFSAIRNMGEVLFRKKKKIATITYDGDETDKVVFVSKERFFEDDAIFFAYLISDNDNISEVDLRELSDAIFIDIKMLLKNRSDASGIQKKVDNVLKRMRMIRF